MSDLPDPPAICPECAQGKHANCTGDILVDVRAGALSTAYGFRDDDLVWEPCECAVCRAAS